MMKMDLRKLSDNAEYNPQTGMPTDETHFECGLPQYLSKSLENMKKSYYRFRKKWLWYGT